MSIPPPNLAIENAGPAAENQILAHISDLSARVGEIQRDHVHVVDMAARMMEMQESQARLVAEMNQLRMSTAPRTHAGEPAVADVGSGTGVHVGASGSSMSAVGLGQDRLPPMQGVGGGAHQEGVLRLEKRLREFAECMPVQESLKGPDVRKWDDRSKWEIKKSYPVYEDKLQPFSTYLKRIIGHAHAHGVSFLLEENGGFLKCIVQMHLPEEAKNLFDNRWEELIRLGPSVTVFRVMAEIGVMMEPPVSSSEYYRRFLSYVQGRDQGVRMYLENKKTLYIKSRPQYVEACDFIQLKEAMIDGLYNPSLKNRAVECNDMNSVDFINSIANMAAQELTKVVKGYASGSREGLSTSVELRGKERTAARSVNVVEQVNEVRTAGNDAPRRSNANPRVCWDCGSPSHFQKSSYCKEPGARKFAPKNGGGRRMWNQGNRRGGTGRGGNRRPNPSNQVNQVEESVQGETQEDYFLGNGGDQPRQT